MNKVSISQSKHVKVVLQNVHNLQAVIIYKIIHIQQATLKRNILSTHAH